MFLLVSVRHVGAHPGEHQHGVSIQISINLGKTFLRISRIRNIPLIWILARVFAYLPPFISQILVLIHWTALIFILIYFEWRDIENQQFHFSLPLTKDVRRSAFGKPLFLSIKKLCQPFSNIHFSPLEVSRPYVGWIFSQKYENRRTQKLKERECYAVFLCYLHASNDPLCW